MVEKYTITSVTLDSVLAQARQLSPAEQARLIEALRPTADVETARRAQTPHRGVSTASAVDDDDLAEQQATWAYLQQVLDEDRLSARPLFPQASDRR